MVNYCNAGVSIYKNNFSISFIKTKGKIAITLINDQAMSNVNFTSFRRKVTSNGEGCLAVYDDIESDIKKKIAELDIQTDESLFTKKCEEINKYLDDQKNIYGVCYEVRSKNTHSYIADDVEKLLLKSNKYSKCPRQWKSEQDKITKLETKKDEPRDGDGKHGIETTELEEQRISKPNCEDESCVPKNLECGEVSHNTSQNVGEKGITADGSSESSQSTVPSDNSGVTPQSINDQTLYRNAISVI
ncbi:hypothetical protein PCYB_004150 [Plasmodium cynomolgi strain B]|uniref:Uncharacterized protein n=1 Tax=Plasmodium cynomolgi (strain B) TaxID=1120755 RepID=K6UF86_PLACD|nr:hypothetical protein PCYB_004150 [Plasmodium cynomolgi strain B]GAB69666.1 hypothetical protein PCYB_004150 [Plasmodium cynomolgi strain B]